MGDGTYDDALKTLTEKFLRDGVIGTPEECAERIAFHRETIDPSEIVGIGQVGTMPVASAERSIRLLAEKVLPRFDDVRVRAENDPWTGRGRSEEPRAAAAARRQKEPV
jgi:hypothetical protein